MNGRCLKLIAVCRQRLICIGVCVQASGLPAQQVKRIERMISQLDAANEELLRQKAVAEAQLGQQGIADEAAVRPQAALRGAVGQRARQQARKAAHCIMTYCGQLCSAQRAQHPFDKVSAQRVCP